MSIRGAQSLYVVPVAVWLAAQPAFGLLVAPPATNDNTAAPMDDPGWLNVGDRGIYLGNRWVLTAFHVGAGTTTFPGVGTFTFETGTDMRVENPSGMGLTQFADILLYRLTTDPGLPPLTLSSGTPAIDDEVTFIGDGGAVTPAATETHWDVTGTSPNFTWTEVMSGGDAHGYVATTSRKLWGTNLIEDDEPFFNETDADHVAPVSTGNGDTISFITEFDKTGLTLGMATDSETQALSGDSGSAVFYKVGGNWVLAGLTHAIAFFEDQPNVGSTAVFGNLTFAADLSAYRDAILSITSVPELGGFRLLGGVAIAAGLCRLFARRFSPTH